LQHLLARSWLAAAMLQGVDDTGMKVSWHLCHTAPSMRMATARKTNARNSGRMEDMMG
jgi:hypothetical protein